jgi:hypothetical protein
MQIMRVSEFNREADNRYRHALERHEFGKGGFPHRPMFVFKTPKGQDRKRGFVVIEREGSYRFFLKRQDLHLFMQTGK